MPAIRLPEVTMTKPSDAHIRPGTEADLPQIMELIRELAAYELEPDAVDTSIEELRQDGFGKGHRWYELVVAEGDAGRLLGMALCTYMYSTWKGRTLYLEDLIVRESARRQGLGRRLMDAVMARARRLGVRRVQWQVLDWNEPAIRFYEALGAAFDGGWSNVKFEDESIRLYESAGPASPEPPDE